MRFKSLLIILFIGLSLAAFGCSGTGPANTGNAANANANVANSAIANADNPVATNKKPEVATTNAAPTIAPVVHAYYEALKKKDDKALPSILSKDFIESIQADMKEEKKTGMAAYLAEYDTIPEKPVEVRNEKIEGNKAVAEIKGGAYINWTPFAFINEGGKWKFTGGSPDIQNVASEASPNVQNAPNQKASKDSKEK